jgi:hypothetical protein
VTDRESIHDSALRILRVPVRGDAFLRRRGTGHPTTLGARRVSEEGIDENSRKRYRLALNRCTSAAANLSEHLMDFFRDGQPTIKYRVRVHADSESA